LQVFFDVFRSLLTYFALFSTYEAGEGQGLAVKLRDFGDSRSLVWAFFDVYKSRVKVRDCGDSQ